MPRIVESQGNEAQGHTPTDKHRESDNIESGIPGAGSLQVAYIDGRGSVRVELHPHLRYIAARRLAAAAHIHDTLAGALLSIIAERAAYHRGRADALAERAELELDDRDLAGCVDTCADCRGTGARSNRKCATCGGAGLAYSPARVHAYAVSQGVARG